MAFFRNLKIGRKIGGGFFAVLLLLALMAGVVLVGQGRTTDTVERYDRLMTNTLRISSIDSDLNDIRRLVRIILAGGDARSINQIKELESAVKADLAKVLGVETDPARRTSIERFTMLFDEYAVSIDRVVDARGARDRLFTGQTAAREQGP